MNLGASRIRRAAGLATAALALGLAGGSAAAGLSAAAPPAVLTTLLGGLALAAGVLAATSPRSCASAPTAAATPTGAVTPTTAGTATEPDAPTTAGTAATAGTVALVAAPVAPHADEAQAAVHAATQAAGAQVAAAAQVAATQVAATQVAAARAAEELFRRREAELAGFAVTASEHLHAPLHTIAGFTELLLEDLGPGLDEEARGFIQRIEGATRRMLGVVGDLLAYASAGDAALNPEPVEASLLALDVAAAHLPGPAIEIGELPAIAGDAALLRQVLDELVGNAVRFVRHGAEARISVGAREIPGGWWRIEVADRGIGVPAEQRDRIFAPFHRAPSAESYPGAGLGLAVCARILALHGGEIGVEPNPGGGSVFWFTVAGAELGTRELTSSPG